MSIRSRSDSGHKGRSGNRTVYATSFRRQVHGLIRIGYQRLDAARYRQSQEPEITGELVKAIRSAIEGANAPPWAFNYAVHDDPPQSVGGLLGKKRPRVDIEFERTQRGSHPRFQFEAKRLNDGASVTDYLGKDGLGCFLDGRYAEGHDEGGMLGYVQSNDEDAWARRIGDRVAGDPGGCRLGSNGGWRLSPVAAELRHTFRTRHTRGKQSDITIYHTLLRFC